MYGVSVSVCVLVLVVGGNQPTFLGWLVGGTAYDAGRAAGTNHNEGHALTRKMKRLYVHIHCGQTPRAPSQTNRSSCHLGKQTTRSIIQCPHSMITFIPTCVSCLPPLVSPSTSAIHCRRRQDRLLISGRLWRLGECEIRIQSHLDTIAHAKMI